MSDWLSPNALRFNEGEDGEALKAEFIRLCAKYPNQPIFEIGPYVFRGLPDANARGCQAATIWSNSVEVQDAIGKYKINDGLTNAEEITPDQLKIEVLALARNPRVGDKERVAAYKLLAEMNGLAGATRGAGGSKSLPANAAEFWNDLADTLPT